MVEISSTLWLPYSSTIIYSTTPYERRPGLPPTLSWQSKGHHSSAVSATDDLHAFQIHVLRNPTLDFLSSKIMSDLASVSIATNTSDGWHRPNLMICISQWPMPHPLPPDFLRIPSMCTTTYESRSRTYSTKPHLLGFHSHIFPSFPSASFISLYHSHFHRTRSICPSLSFSDSCTIN